MKTIKRLLLVTFLLVSIAYSVQWAYAQEGDPPLEPTLSVEGISSMELGLPVVIVDNPNQQNIKIPGPTGADALNELEAANATFTIAYVENGGTDAWDKACLTFPEEAKTAFNAAAAIWATHLNSAVPITIRACWANLGDSSILGYSGGGSSRNGSTKRLLEIIASP